MAESTVIKSFLVALGYKHDEAALKKFKTGLTDITKSVVKLGLEIEATALAVSIGVARWASSLEELYFASQRTNSTASGLKAFDLAARNFGASVDEAQGSVEGLAAFLRNNPGGESFLGGWLKQVGESTRDNNGHLRSGVELMGALGKLFQQQRAGGQGYLANQLAGQLGISDRTMLAISTPGFQEEQARQEKRTRGWDAVTKAAHRFKIELEDLKMQLEQLFLRFEGPAMRALEHLMASFSKLATAHGKQAIDDLVLAFDWLIKKLEELFTWLNAHGDEIQKRIQEAFGEIAKVYKIVKPAIEWVYEMLVKLDSATGGWSTKLLVAAAALKAMGATGIITGILSLSGAFAKLAAAMFTTAGGTAVAAGGATTGVLAGLGVLLSRLGIAGLAIGAGTALGYGFDKMFPNNWLAQIGEKLGSGVFDAKEYANQMYAHEKLRQMYYDPNGTGENRPFPSKEVLDSSPINFQQKTDIIIHGTDQDKASLARLIAAEQSRVNAAIMREFAPSSR
jgi:hypothetical protein